MASPWRAPRSAAAAGRRPVFPFFGRECRILVRAHGRWLPEAHALEGTRIPLRGAAGPVRSKSLSQLHCPIPAPGFLPPRGAVQRVSSSGRDSGLCPLSSRVSPSTTRLSRRIAVLGQSGWSFLFCGNRRCHQPVAPWPLLALPPWPLRSAPPTGKDGLIRNSPVRIAGFQNSQYVVSEFPQLRYRRLGEILVRIESGHRFRRFR
jgi:hypothetical protein